MVFITAKELPNAKKSVGSVIDITEYKKAEEELRESEKNYRDLVNHSNDIVIKVDVNGRWVFLSPAFKEILGYEPTEMIGNSIFDIVLPEDVEYTLKISESIVNEGKKSSQHNSAAVTKHQLLC